MSEKTIQAAAIIREELNRHHGGPRPGITEEKLKKIFDWVAEQMDDQLANGMTNEDIADYWKLYAFPNTVSWSSREHEKRKNGEANGITKYWGRQGRVRQRLLALLKTT
jgi:hypothetical protein